MDSRRVISLVAGMVLAGGLASLHAQEPVAAPQPADTAVQGYAPESPAVTPVPNPAPSAAPAPAPTVTTTPSPSPAAAPAPRPTVQPAPSATVAAPAAARAPAGRAAIGAQLGFIDVLPTRTLQRISADEDDARADQKEAEAELSYATEQKEKTKAMVAVKKQEVSTIDAKRKLAEKSKQEAEVVTLEAEKKDAERHKEFLERRASLHEAEIDRARAAKKLAGASLRALELERQLVTRRDERAGAGNDPAAMRRHDAVILELEGKTLEAERNQSEAQKQVADKDVDIARRRLELHKAQVAAAGE